MSFSVSRCVCCDISFQDLLHAAQNQGATTTEKLHEVAIFGTGCGLCLPYVGLMLRTGRVAFKVEEATPEATTEEAKLEKPISSPSSYVDRP